MQKEKLSFNDIQTNVQNSIEMIIQAGEHRSSFYEQIIQNTHNKEIKILNKEQFYCENIPNKIAEICAYYNFIGYKKFLEIINKNYSPNEYPKPGDIIIERKQSGKCHIGFVTSVETFISFNFVKTSFKYVLIIASFVAEDTSIYTENRAIKLLVKNFTKKLEEMNISFGRSLDSCLPDLENERHKIENEYKRRQKKKILTVGEYEEMISMIQKLNKNIVEINNKIPNLSHYKGPM